MTTYEFLTQAWHWKPSVLVGCVALVIGYIVAAERRLSRQALCYLAGVAVLFLALVSPLDTLSHTYLFSAHMLQHLLIIQIVPPLLLLGLPAPLAEQMLAYRPLGRTVQALGSPAVAWLLGIAMIYIWHLPRLYNAALRDETIHIVEHLCFLVSSTIFWWPVLAPLRGARLPPLLSILYLFLASLAGSILGIILTFAPLQLYPAYLSPIDPIGIAPLLRNEWGLSPAVDQQLGGLLMWVAGGLIYFFAILGLLVEWYEREDEYEEHAPGAAAHRSPAIGASAREEQY